MSHSVLFGNSPWSNRDLLDNDPLLKRYFADDWLLDGVPVVIVRSCFWHYQFECSHLDFCITPRTARDAVRSRFARRAMD